MEIDSHRLGTAGGQYHIYNAENTLGISKKTSLVCRFPYMELASSRGLSLGAWSIRGALQLP